MQSIHLFPGGLALGGLVLTSLGAKAIAEVMSEPSSLLRRILALVFAVALVIIGAVATGGALTPLVPDSWGRDGYWVLLTGMLTAAAALPLWLRRHGARHTITAAPLVAASSTSPAQAAPPQVAPVQVAPPPGTARQVWPHPGLPAGFAAIRAKRVRNARNVARIVLVLAVPAVYLAAINFGVTGVCIALVATALIAIKSYDAIDGVGAAEYVTLPGATDATGKHRCVHCGHRGVYCKGEYATSFRYSECTGCRKHLFAD